MPPARRRTEVAAASKDGPCSEVAVPAGWGSLKYAAVAVCGAVALAYGSKLITLVACIVRITAEGGRGPRDCWVDPPPVPHGY